VTPAFTLLAVAAAAEFVLTGVPEQGGVLTGVAPRGTVALALDGQPVGRAADNRFLIAFDRDAPATATLSAKLADGRTVERRLAVAPRQWRLERVDVPRRPSVTDEAFEKLRAPEIARINAARAVMSDSLGWRQRFASPPR
jgi:hypothetical protein